MASARGSVEQADQAHRAVAAEHVDTVVVGSGFGGSVSAFRLAEAGREVVVLERGKAYPPGSFPRDPAGLSASFWDPSQGRYGMFNIWSFQGLEAVVSAGLGGGSLIYANVLIRKDERWFVDEEPIPGGGYESWPVTREDLEPHYERVERMLSGVPYPYPDTTHKTAAYRAAARRAGLDWSLPLLAVSFRGDPGSEDVPGAPIRDPDYGNLYGLPRRTCVLCGECDIGCNVGSKNTLDHTYLSAAAHHGADIRTGHEVRGFAPRAGGGYEVRYVVHQDVAEQFGHARSPSEGTLTCDSLILAAGALGTTFLLLRNRGALPALSDALGTRFSGNGDLLGFVMDARTPEGPVRLQGSRGPVITSAVRVPDRADGGGAGGELPTSPRHGRGHYVEDAGYPVLAEWLVESAQLAGGLRRAARFGWNRALAAVFGDARSDLGHEVSRLIGSGTRSGSSMPLLGMGRDVPDGVMRLRDGWLDVDWTTRTSQEYFDDVYTTMRSISEQLGADFAENPLWWLKRVVTVHPLGGAPMGADPRRGVCDSYGQVYGYPGLYVADGAVMPGPVGPNPCLTIAALANRMSERMLEQHRAAPAAASAEAPPSATPAVSAAPHTPAVSATPAASAEAPSPGATPSGVSFTEEMKGWVGWSEAEPKRGADIGQMRGQHLMFRLTITVDDVDGFLADPAHLGRAEGYVHHDMLGGRLPVERGWFNLFVTEGEPSTRAMRYRLHIRDGGGNPVTLIGRKDIADDPGLDVWADTTTLFTRLYAGHLGDIGWDGPEPIAAGVITIAPLDFAKQLTTFRTSGPEGKRALTAFGHHFLGQLWEVYGARRGLTGRQP